jgi:hypothetical protein
LAVAFGIFNDPHHRHPTQSRRASVATELAADERQQPACANLRTLAGRLWRVAERRGVIGMFRNAVVERIEGDGYR